MHLPKVMESGTVQAEVGDRLLVMIVAEGCVCLHENFIDKFYNKINESIESVYLVYK